MLRAFVIFLIALSVLILVVSAGFFLFVWPKQKVDFTAMIVVRLSDAVREYENDHLSLPPVTVGEFHDALLGNNERGKSYLGEKEIPARDRKFIDFWRREIEVVKTEPGDLAIRSLGKDGKAGTPDDIDLEAAQSILGNGR